jgi:galactokinase/mevalonate kinase-like predicted kinase
MTRRIEAIAPTRIDFAGGTVDLWPLSLLHEEPLTVNAAIDRHARAVVEDAPDGVEVISRDRGARLGPLPAGRLAAEASGAPAELEFLLRLAAHFLGGVPDAAARGGRSCRITTDCAAPAGSGLGGSSTLGIALASALDRYVGRGLAPDALLSLTRAIETQVLRIPTGEQDYHPALRGGVLALHYTVEGTRVERLDVDLEELRRRTVLVDTGVSRSSGISNWDMLKRHVDGDPAVRGALAGAPGRRLGGGGRGAGGGVGPAPEALRPRHHARDRRSHRRRPVRRRHGGQGVRGGGRRLRGPVGAGRASRRDRGERAQGRRAGARFQVRRGRGPGHRIVIAPPRARRATP